MKAMILAAGRGKRMKDLTTKLPKPLLLIKGEPLIVHQIKALKNAGICDIVINLHYLGDMIKAELKKGDSWGVNIEYSEEDPVLETGGGIAKALPLLGDKPFVVISSDVYTDYSYQQLPHAISGLLHMVLVDNPPHHPTGDYALIHGKVREAGGPLLNFGGIAVYHPELFVGCPQGYFPISLLFKKAIQADQVTGEYYQGVWHNLGTPEQLAELQI